MERLQSRETLHSWQGKAYEELPDNLIGWWPNNRSTPSDPSDRDQPAQHFMVL